MSITDSFPMRKRRSIDKTPGRSTSNSNGGRNIQITPRRITSNNSFLEQGLEIIWDNNSPSPTRTLHLGKRKKKLDGSDSSSSGGEISDLVKKLADKSGQTPEGSSLLKYWMQRDDQTNVENQTTKVNKKKNFTTPASRRPRRGLRRGKRSNVKQLTKELEMLAHQMEPTDPDQQLNTEGATISTSPSIMSPAKQKLGTRDCESTIPKVQRKPLNTIPCANKNSLHLATTEQTGLPTGSKVISPVKITPDLEDDYYWDDDDDDDIVLSQVDISALCGATQVFSDTQLLDSGEKSKFNGDMTLDLGGDVDDNVAQLHDSVVTELWDFTDDLGDEDSILLSTLQEVEQSQQINREPTSIMLNMNKTSGLDKKDVFKQTAGYSKTISTLHDGKSSKYTSVKENSNRNFGKQTSNIVTKEVSKSAASKGDKNTKPKYSKEDIERKKQEAQQRRKQRQAGSQRTQTFTRSRKV